MNALFANLTVRSLARVVGLLALAATPVFSAGCASDTSSEDEGTDEGAVSAAAQFQCPAADGKMPEFEMKEGADATSFLTAARAAGQPTLGVDRFVLEFKANGAAPWFNIVPQDSSTFSGTGEKEFTLAGKKGLGIHVHHASAGWPVDDSGFEYKGPQNIKPGDTTVIKEAQYIEDFEADLYWAVGLEKASCYRAYRLSNPPRLVVDVKR